MQVSRTFFCFLLLGVSSNLAIQGSPQQRIQQKETVTWNPNSPNPAVPHSQCNDVDGPLILTPYIQSGDLETARSLSSVHLWRTNQTSYAGYFTVNKTDNSNMFFWFFPAEVQEPEKAPVVLWLQGGPGSSSMFGLFVEHGPYRIHESMKLTIRPYRWTKLANMLYIDNPVGTGFSFTGSNDGYSRNQEQVGRNLYEALLQFYVLFPQYQAGDFYVTGESYGGKYVPAISHRIHVENPNATLKIPLKGLAIGNGLVDPAAMMQYGDLLYQFGMVDEAQREVFHGYENQFRKAVAEERWRDAFVIFDTLLNGDKIPFPTYFYNVTHSKYYFNILRTDEPAEFGYFAKYLNQCYSRKAIHVGNQEYSNGSLVEDFMLDDIAKSTTDLLTVLLDNYRVMIYNGALDIICGLPLTEAYLQKLTWKNSDVYKKADRVIWKVHPNDTEVAGYVRHAGDFFQVAVRSGGHMLPYDQPRSAYDMLKRFLYGPGFSN